MEKMKIWEKAENLHGHYDIMKVVDDEDGLKIFLADENNEIIVSYDTIVCSYQTTEESFFIKDVEKLIVKYG